MIPVLYDGGAIDPRRLGKGKLSDVISCVVHEELNGDFSLTFQYPITGVHYDEMTIGSSIVVIMPCFNKTDYHPSIPVSSERGTKRDIQVFDIYKKSTPIDGVVTFYSFFSLTPKGKYVIGVCLGTACYVKGAQQIIDKFSEIIGIQPGETSEDGLFTLDALRCIGACGIAPAVSINGKVYSKVKVDEVTKIVNEYKKEAAQHGIN